MSTGGSLFPSAEDTNECYRFGAIKRPLTCGCLRISQDSSTAQPHFVADQLADGRRFRALTAMDIYTREALAIEVGQSLKGEE